MITIEYDKNKWNVILNEWNKILIAKQNIQNILGLFMNLEGK